MIVFLIVAGVAALPLLAVAWWAERPVPQEPDCAPGCHCRGR